MKPIKLLLWTLSLVALLTVPLVTQANTTFFSEDDIRECVINAAQHEIGVKEVTHNSSPEIDAYLATVQFKPGAAWCGAFVANRIGECIDINQMDTYLDLQKWAFTPYTYDRAVEKDLITYSCLSTNRQSSITPRSGDVFWIYNAKLDRVAHTGLIDTWHPYGNLVITIEGNTNTAGSREGDGVMVMYRDKRQIYAAANVLKGVLATT